MAQILNISDKKYGKHSNTLMSMKILVNPQGNIVRININCEKSSHRFGMDNPDRIVDIKDENCLCDCNSNKCILIMSKIS